MIHNLTQLLSTMGFDETTHKPLIYAKMLTKNAIDLHDSLGTNIKKPIQ